MGAYWGRFNPPHQGHLGVVRQLRERYRLIIAIGSTEHRDERENPFSGTERKAMWAAYLKESRIPGVRVVTVEDGDSETRAVGNLMRRCRPDTVLLSTERRGPLERALARAGVRVVRFPRRGTVSSTRIRRLVAAVDPSWRALTGRSVARLMEEFGGIERIRRTGGRTTRPGPRRPARARAPKLDP